VRPPAPRRRVAPPRRRAARRVVASKHSRAAEFRFGAGQPRHRLIVLLGALVLVLSLVLFKVGVLQTSEGQALRVEGTRQWTRSRDLPADRGTIFDRNGEELAMSVAASSVSINPKLIDDAEGTASILTDVLGLSEESRQELIAAIVAKATGFMYVARQVDESVGEQIAALGLSGVNVDGESKRILPGGDTGRSVIGRTDIDGVGIGGLELQYDDLLTGTAGRIEREVGPGGQSIAGSEAVSVAPIAGDDVVLTLDRSIQFATEQALLGQVEGLGARGGTGIVMDTDTGEIYAMASVRRNEDTGAVEITSGNFAAVDAYEPGSVAKVITVAAALNEGAVTPDTGFNVPWRELWGEHLLADAEQHPDEWLTVAQILIKSSNVGTIHVHQTIGRQKHWEYMRAFGLGEATALGFPGESPGIMKNWNDLWGAERVTMAFGQGVSSTSIQLAAAINVIANDGTYVAPKLVRSTVGPAGTLTDTLPSATREVVVPATAEEMQRIMTRVVCEGTGERAQVKGFDVAGKTGTGYKAQPDGTYFDENGERVYYSSFVGFFPAEDPQVTVLISIDEPPAGTDDRFGGTAAAPVFRELAPTIVHELGIRPTTGTAGCEAG
jgi:cell division protein FtsI (penicillin-binding protein 3)